MTTPATYALLPAAAYADIRSQADNEAPILEGWVELKYAIRSAGNDATFTLSGLSAGCFVGRTERLLSATREQCSRPRWALWRI